MGQVGRGREDRWLQQPVRWLHFSGGRWVGAYDAGEIVARGKRKDSPQRHDGGHGEGSKGGKTERLRSFGANGAPQDDKTFFDEARRGERREIPRPKIALGMTRFFVGWEGAGTRGMKPRLQVGECGGY